MIIPEPLHQKDYFIKWLPVEGKIKDGDSYLFEGKINLCKVSILPELEKLYGRKMVEYQKVKLFLCSKKIELGDKAFYTSNPLVEFIVTESNHHALDIAEGFKIIGQLPDDTWVDEGRQLYEEQWRFFAPEIGAVLDKKMMLKPPYLLRTQYIIQIQCEHCKQFH